MAALDPVNRIEVSSERSNLYLVAGSFEPRSVRATELLGGSVERAVVFSYDDTVNIEMGRRNTRKIEAILRTKSQSLEVLQCKVAEPFSVISAFHTYVTQEQLVGSVRSVVLDATCFTKLHLLLLLRFLRDWLFVETTQICYTKPLMYGTAFGRELSYGIRETVYLPYCGAERSGNGTGLIALLGHEPRRLERLVQEIEPDLCMVVLGEPGFTTDIVNYSRQANKSLIRRAEYDRHYRLVYAPVDDIEGCVIVLAELLEDLHENDCGHVYVAPLGTKLQALAVNVLSQRNDAVRLSLAYAVPERYEYRNYSQGIGETVVTTLTGQKEGAVGNKPIPTGGAVVTDADVDALRDELGI